MAQKESLHVYKMMQSVTNSAVLPAYSNGIPIYSIAPPEDFGLERMDNMQMENDPLFPLRHLRQEGQMLGGEDTLELSDGRKLIIFTTAAASSHTPLCVPYEEFDAVWRNRSKEHNIEVQEGVLMKGKSSTQEKIVPPQSVPLDIITWTMLTDKDGTIIGPVDFGDLVGQQMEVDVETLKKYQLNLQSVSEGADLLEFYKRFTNRLLLSSEVVHELYNKYVRKAIPWLPEKEPKDITSYSMIGYYRGDPIKGLKQHQYDGLGEGPQSNSMAHGRSTVNLRPGNLDAISTLTGWNRQTINDELKSHPQYFKGSIDRIIVSESHSGSRKVRSNILEQPRIIESMIKQIDPYSSILHVILEDWLVNKLRLSRGKVSSFRHHSELTHKYWRIAEGIEILTDQPLEESLYQINIFIGNMYDIWRETQKAYEYYLYGFMLDGIEKKDVEKRMKYIEQIRLNFGLPLSYSEAVTQLMPTEKQIALWKQNVSSLQPSENIREETLQSTQQRLDRFQRAYQIMKKKYGKRINELDQLIKEGKATHKDLEERLQLELNVQIFTETDSGYNIPGVPSFDMSFHYDEDKWHIFLSPLLSKKGVAEQWSGHVLMREERKSQIE